MKRILTFLVALAALVGCHPTKALLPNVSGKAGEVIVVIDRENWEGALGTQLREVLGGNCSYLEPAEPMFSLANVTPGSFADLFHIHRNILIININPQIQEAGVVYRSNMWARPQCVIQLNAVDSESALALFEENGERITSAIEQAERDRIIENSILYEEATLRKPVEAATGGILHFPSGYKFKKAVDGFVWIADEKQYIMQGVLIYTYPASEADDFSMESIIAHRNAALKANVPGMFPDTYMTTGEYPVPQVEFMRYKGRQFAQTRGYWEVENDYMGGPFVSHSFYSKDGSSVIVLDAFVYGPKYDKRQYLRQVESILYSFEWAEDVAERKKSK